MDDDSSNDDIDSDGNSSADVRVSHWSNKRTKQEPLQGDKNKVKQGNIYSTLSLLLKQ